MSAEEHGAGRDLVLTTSPGGRSMAGLERTACQGLPPRTGGRVSQGRAGRRHRTRLSLGAHRAPNPAPSGAEGRQSRTLTQHTLPVLGHPLGGSLPPPLPGGRCGRLGAEPAPARAPPLRIGSRHRLRAVGYSFVGYSTAAEPGPASTLRERFRVTVFGEATGRHRLRDRRLPARYGALRSRHQPPSLL